MKVSRGLIRVRLLATVIAVAAPALLWASQVPAAENVHVPGTASGKQVTEARGPLADPLFFWAHENPRFYTVATDIDRHGNVVGWYYRLDDGPFGSSGTGFIRHFDGTYEDIAGPFADATTTFVTGINSQTIIGYSSGVGFTRSWKLDRATGTYTEIAAEGAVFTEILSINESGTIVGLAGFVVNPSKPSTQVGYILKNGVTEFVKTPEQDITRITAVNGVGEMIGDNGRPGRDTFFLAPDGTRTPLVTKPDQPVVSADSLSNDGDVFSSCPVFQDYLLCVREAASGRSYYSLALSTCGMYFYPFVQSAKGPAVVGSCSAGSQLLSQAFVISKHDVKQAKGEP